MKNNKKILEFKSFAKNFRADDRIAIVYDSDPDGLSSAVIASKAIERLRGNAPEAVFFQSHSIVSLQDSTLQKLKEHKINKLIVLDLAVDQDAKQVKKAEKFLYLLVLDHHKTYKNISSKKTVFLKANEFSFLDPSKYATAKLAFDLFSEVVDISDLKWVACVGLIGDCSLRAWKKFFDETYKETMTSEKELRSLVELVSSVETVNRPKIGELYKEFFNAKKPGDLKNSKFKNYKSIVQKELQKLSEEFHQKKEIFPEQELVFFSFKSKFDIKSILVNNISSKFYPDKTVVIVEDKGHGIMTLSARRQDFKVKMNDLLENSVKGLKGAMAGGHIPAAGGKIDKKDFKKFKENIIKNLGK
ncbi:MAG: DHHA1 domain-containing protein [archaeon]